MVKIKIIFVKRRILYLAATFLLVSFLAIASLFIYLPITPANIFVDPQTNIIVIDPGHGGIDGGTNKGGILEKEINLDISKRLKFLLEQKGYTVIMTREEDISLDKLDGSSRSRHQKDLNARVNIINNSNAQLFLSIHVNCNLKKPITNGSIVFYNNRFEQNKTLAYCIQKSLNAVEIDGKKRTTHNPVKSKYFILGYSNIPGVIVETAFISNNAERQELVKGVFKDEIAKAIAIGAEKYLNESGKILSVK